ncbi:MAG TPA: DNA-processing protein DprA [Anaerolineales bacterium]
MIDPRQYWVGFNLVKGIGAARLRALLDFFGDAAVAWQAPPDALRAAGLGPKVLESLLKVRAQVSLDQVWEHIQAQGITILTWDDEGYPRYLKEIDQPPPVLYLLGEFNPVDEWAVAIVGTRRVTAYGRQVTQQVACTLARHGVTVVSGLARGVDAAAHEAALNAGGRTMAVLGSGVDRIYPPENRQLANRIRGQGAVLSDYAPGTPPDAINFPPRNRIISGLARAVVVVEAGETSGALITATFAVDQGREVFAVPGHILSPQSKGTNRLIQQGARPLLDCEELLENLNLALAGEQQAVRAVLPGDATEAALFALLGNEPMHVDEIRAQADLPIEKVSATLALMELKGLVRQLGGMQYVAVREPGNEYETG